MAYQALARKYRPEHFSDLIGQETLAQALMNALRLGREPCGVIFSGVRGIGKTTSARIFAKTLNCEAGSPTGPCHECYSCKAISGSYHEDVLEIDGASNNGVAEIRALQETLAYTPQRSRYKVYIIDEVHMLSQSAFNALLKTLEEPPQNVIFIFATTELHKVPKTVLSRCQTFHLKRVELPAIQKLLREILIKENIPFEESALAIIAQAGNGSVRDALTFLDQVIALGDGKVSQSSSASLFSCLSSSFLVNLLDALLGKKAKSCLELIAEMDKQGVEYEQVTGDLASYLRHAMILKSLGPNFKDDSFAKLSDEDKIQLVKIIQQSSDLSSHQLFRNLMGCLKEFDGSWLDRFVFENCCLEWCLQTEVSAPNLKGAPISQSEARAPAPLPQAARAPVQKPTQQQVAPPQQLRSNTTTSVANSSPSSQTSGMPLSFPRTWEEFIERVKALRPIQGRKLEELHLVEYSELKIVLAADSKSFAGEELLKSDIQSKFQQLFRDFLGFKGLFEVVDKSRFTTDQKAPALPESPFEVKSRKEAELRKQIEIDAHQHPMTQAVLTEFGGRIEKTDVNL